MKRLSANWGTASDMSPKIPSPRVGDEIRVDFLDHCEDGDGEAIQFTVYGRVLKINRAVLQVGCWVYTAPTETDSNEKKFDIVRKAVTNVRIFNEP
jgi:hypothetical protein